MVVSVCVSYSLVKKVRFLYANILMLSCQRVNKFTEKKIAIDRSNYFSILAIPVCKSCFFSSFFQSSCYFISNIYFQNPKKEKEKAKAYGKSFADQVKRY